MFANRSANLPAPSRSTGCGFIVHLGSWRCDGHKGSFGTLTATAEDERRVSVSVVRQCSSKSSRRIGLFAGLPCRGTCRAMWAWHSAEAVRAGARMPTSQRRDVGHPARWRG
jgi:hypothetical protein